jgi:multiple sugar transport system permease protein
MDSKQELLAAPPTSRAYPAGSVRSSVAARMGRLERQSLVIPVAVLLVLVTIFPLLYSLAVSLHVYDLRQDVLWNWVGLSHYGEVLTGDSRFWKALVTTARIGLAAVALEFVLGFAIALLLYYPIRGRRVFTTLLVLPVMISPVVTALIFRMMFHEKYGVINGTLNSLVTGLGWGKEFAILANQRWAVWAVTLTDVWQWTPLMVMILLAGLQSVPLEPLEAAKVDGASRWQIFWYVVLPLMRLPMFAALLIRFIDVIKIFDIPFILTGGGPGSATETISIYIYLLGFRYLRMGYATAVSYLLLILTVILSTIFIRRVVQRRTA